MLYFPNSAATPKMLTSFIKFLSSCLIVLALSILGFACLELVWPGSIVRNLGCFGTYNGIETYLLLPIHSYTLEFAVISAGVVASVLLYTRYE